MICFSCGEGNHCGRPGEKTPSCSCQHHPPGTRQAAEPEDEGS
jgi:hypothetical protein